MNKPIIREPGQRLPIDYMWNVAAQVENPTKEILLILEDYLKKKPKRKKKSHE